ncbi:hypothetical protein NX772_02295 [Mesomycoplasma molare]|uniref:Uncharacterized protein n=2 Tax=Mesomycoplasma molare TaxID=171288 RepID=A0ABY5TTC3_9BACT|nr:hypothetical protein [Mesomycoplasma molare]UWD33919.1 hypothetical protein NX772_02295 [Mesomycoplasma molare]
MLQKMIPALILIFGIPLLSFVVINIFNTFFNIFTISINNNQNISHNIFLSLKPQEIDLKTWKDLTIDNSFGIIPFEEYTKINISSSELLFFPSIVGITLLSIFIKNAIYLSNKTFQYFFLFLISPFVFSTMLFDGGKRFNNWNKMYFSKLISIFVYILGLKIFSFYSVIINNSINGIDNIYNFTKLSLFSILLIGGAYSISKFVKMISNLLGESHTFRSTLIENKLIYENIKEIMSQNFYSNYINKKNCVIQSLKEKNITFSKISDKELKSKNLFQTINFDNNKEFRHKRSDYAST